MKGFFTFLFGTLAVAASGQSLNEQFENGIPDSWTVVNTDDTYKIETVKYSEEYDLANNIITGYESGGEQAIKSTTGYKMETEEIDQWLISPQISVESGDVLNFMMAYHAVYSGNTWTEEANRIKFDVMVSTGGTEASDFTTLLSLTPQNVANWSNYSIALDRFAGQQVHVAFRNYGTPADTPLLSNALYIDNVRVDKNRVSDLQVTAITSPYASCATQQNVTATVSNTGFDCASFQISYQIDNEPAVTETVGTPIAGGESMTYTFATQALLTSGSQHNVKVWAEAASDSNHDNDAATAEVEIGNEIDYPFTMTADNAETAFSSSANRKMGYITMGWQYTNDDMMKGWVFNSGIESYLLSSCIMLPKGIVKLSFDYMALSQCKLNVYLVSEPGKYDNLAGSVELPTAETYSPASLTFTVPDDNVYNLAIMPDANYAGSFYMDNIRISDAEDDIETVSIDSPMLNATLVKSGVSVSASFRNGGSKTIENIPVSFSLDGGTAVTETIGAIEPGQTVKHTFTTATLDLATAGTHTLKVWAAFDGDTNSGNDSKSLEITSYEAYTFPYSTSFEADDNNSHWIRYNADGDIIYWEITGVVDGQVNYAKDGTQAAYINSAAGMEHNDWLISPAVDAQSGDARISFYYTTRMSSSSGGDGCNIDLYLSTTDDPEKIAESEPLARFTLTDENVLVYKQGYASVKIPADGTYYIAFYNGGMGHDIILDDVRFDQAEDLSIVSASNSAQSGFNLTDNDVTVEIANHGTTAQSGFKAAYSVNGGTAVEETVSQSIAPGESLSYTFSKKADVSAPGTYAVTVSITADNDADTYNNSWIIPEFTSYANAVIPYSENFDTEESREKWTEGGQWTIAANMSTSQSAYNGQGGLYHTGAAQDGGDWVYSGCIEIPAGTYDFSFFYRTFMNMTNVQLYGQNFSVYLGTDRNPEAMTIPVYSAEGAIVSTKVYEKVLRQVEVPEHGNYYIGVKCSSTSTLGTLYVDMISISEPVQEGIVLGTYQSDFAGNDDEWYRYNPGDNFTQWQIAEGVDGEECLATQCTSYFYSNNDADLPGLLVAPAFKLKKGDEISVSVDYRINVSNIEDLTDENKEKIKIGLYLADKNLPQAFTTEMATGTAVSDEVQTATGKVTIPADGIYYAGVLAGGPSASISGTVITKYELYSVELQNDNEGGATAAETQKPFVYSDNVIRMPADYSALNIYSVSGLLVGQYSGVEEIDLNNLADGVYIVSVETDSGTATEKIIVK